jgi:hypothetical protein
MASERPLGLEIHPCKMPVVLDHSQDTTIAAVLPLCFEELRRRADTRISHPKG